MAARKDRAVDWFDSLDTDAGDDAADKLDDESVEDFARRKHIVIKNANPRKAKAKRKAAAKKSARPAARKSAKVRPARRARRRNLRRAPAARKNAPRRVKRPASRMKRKPSRIRRGSSRMRRTLSVSIASSAAARSAPPRATGIAPATSGAPKLCGAPAYRRKPTPAYSRLGWKDLQGLEPSVCQESDARAESAEDVGQRARRHQQQDSPATQRRRAPEAGSRDRVSRSAQRIPERRRRLQAQNPAQSAGREQAAARRRDLCHVPRPRARQVVDVYEMTGDPKDLAALGDLVSLIVGQNDYQLQWGKGERPLLATDPDAKQLYIVGRRSEARWADARHGDPQRGRPGRPGRSAARSSTSPRSRSTTSIRSSTTTSSARKTQRKIRARCAGRGCCIRGATRN